MMAYETAHVENERIWASGGHSMDDLMGE
jgi:hypothetical protein